MLSSFKVWQSGQNTRWASQALQQHRCLHGKKITHVLRALHTLQLFFVMTEDPHCDSSSWTVSWANTKFSLTWLILLVRFITDDSCSSALFFHALDSMFDRSVQKKHYCHDSVFCLRRGPWDSKPHSEIAQVQNIASKCPLGILTSNPMSQERLEELRCLQPWVRWVRYLDPG